jgi:Neuraminidase (sialidase)
MSLTLLKSGRIAFNYFGSIAPKDTSKPWQIFSFFGFTKKNSTEIDTSTFVRIDNNLTGNNKFTNDKSGYWLDERGKQVSYEGVSSPVVEAEGKLIVATYGGVPIVKTPNESNRTFSRISLFESYDGGKKWEKQIINPEDCPNINLQEPCLLNIDGRRMIIHIRTQVDRKYSLKDKMMQSLSYDGGKTWTSWKAFDFVGHAPYLYKLSNGAIISAYRDFDPPTGKEGAAFIYSLDNGETWSKPIVFDEPRVDNDSSYPSIQELDNNTFIIVYYTDNGKAIKGRLYRF